MVVSAGVALREVNLGGRDALSLAIDNCCWEMAKWMLHQGCTLTADHVEIARQMRRSRGFGVLYQALSPTRRAEFICRLDLEQKRWLLRVLKVDCAKNLSEEKVVAAFVRYDSFASVSLRQQSMLAVARVIRSHNTTWAAASVGLRHLPLLPILKSELHELLETRFFP